MNLCVMVIRELYKFFFFFFFLELELELELYKLWKNIIIIIINFFKKIWV